MTEVHVLLLEHFLPLLGHSFPIADREGPQVALTLTEATPLRDLWSRPGTRPPFSLIFVGEGPRVLPQQLYRFALNDVGEVDIFLVPVGKSEQGVCYQALFN